MTTITTNPLAKTYEHNGVVLSMHRSRPIRAMRVQAEIASFYVDDTHDKETAGFLITCKDRFIMAECYLLSLYAPDDHALNIYLSNRVSCKSTLERYELFESLVSVDDLNLLYDAFMGTRHVEYPLAPEIADAPTDKEKKSAS